MEHRDLALQNFQTAEQATTPEWQITYYFYAAVHAVNHILFAPGHAPDVYTHGKRRKAISQDPHLVQVEDVYEKLEQASKRARYHAYEHPLPLSVVAAAEQAARAVLAAAGLPMP